MKLTRLAILAVVPVFVSVALASAAQAADAAPDPRAAFERMKTLVGAWQGHHTKPDGPAMEVDYRLTSRGIPAIPPAPRAGGRKCDTGPTWSGE